MIALFLNHHNSCRLTMVDQPQPSPNNGSTVNQDAVSLDFRKDRSKCLVDIKVCRDFWQDFFGGACHVFYKPTQSECCFMNGKCRSTNEYISQILRCFGKTLVAPVINHFHIVMRNFEISKHFRFKPNSLKPPAAFGLEAQPG